MRVSDTIQWLVRKVNELLDKGCRCECGDTGTVGSSPFIDIRWGRQHDDSEVGTSFTKTVVITDTDVPKDYNVLVDKLIVDIPDWDKIADKNPVLLIDRYKAAGRIKAGKYRKAGYKHEPEEKALENNRYSELPLTGPRNILDYLLENYFKINSTKVNGLGMRKRYQAPSTTEGEPENSASFIHIALRLRYTENDEIIETNNIAVLRVNLMYTVYGDDLKLSFAYA